MLKSSSGYSTPEGSFNDSAHHPENPTPISGTSAVKINPNWRTHPTRRIRRVSRAQETHALHLGRAIYRMPTLATTTSGQAHWLYTTHEWLRGLNIRNDARHNLMAITATVGFHADWHTKTTTSLTWGEIAHRTGLSRSTVARGLRRLHEHGWLARVAAGRSAEAKREAGWTGDDAFVNDAPVYLLTEPFDGPVDISDTPPTTSGYKESPARAREADAPTGAATRPNLSLVTAAGGRHTAPVPANPAGPLWPGHARARSKNERVQAALEMQDRSLPLRQISARHIASICRDFMLAGWTLVDVLHAVDNLPDGRPHGHIDHGTWVPYSGADGVSPARLGHWLRFRLNAWRDQQSGMPIESPSQRHIRQRETERSRQAAVARVYAERRAQHRANLADPSYNAARQAAMATIRSRSRRL